MTVLEELGADAHVFFLVDAAPAGDAKAAGARPSRSRARARSSRARVEPQHDAPASAITFALARRPGALPLLRPGDAAAASSAACRGAAAGARADRGLTHEQPDEAEPDEGPGARPDRAPRRRRGDPVGAPAERRPRRLAADGPRGARRPRPRGLPRPQPRLGHVRQRAEDRAGADDDVLHRGRAPPRHEARPAARSRSRSSRPARGSAACSMSRPSEPIVVAKRLRLADRETMAIETLHVRDGARPRPDRGRPRGRFVLRAAARALRRRRSRAASRRSSRR